MYATRLNFLVTAGRQYRNGFSLDDTISFNFHDLTKLSMLAWPAS